MSDRLNAFRRTVEKLRAGEPLTILLGTAPDQRLLVLTPGYEIKLRRQLVEELEAALVPPDPEPAAAALDLPTERTA